MKKPRFKVGDIVTFKGKHECSWNKYYYGGDCQEGVKGKIVYRDGNNSVEVDFISKVDGRPRQYTMLEDEFVEYDSSTGLNMSIKGNKKSLNFGY
jgi:hypothetical protein